MPDSLDYRALVLAKSPVAYWRLGEADGASDAIDETGRHHGKYKGDSKVVGVSGVVTGNGAILFDGKNYLEVPDSADFSQPAHHPSGMTVEAWMRPDVLEFDAHIDRPYVHWMGKGKTNEEEWALRFYRSSAIDRPNRVSGYLFRPQAVDGRTKNLGAGAYFQEPLVHHSWVHVVVCYDPGDCTTYLDPREDPADNVSFIPGVTIYMNGKRKQGPPSLATLYCHPAYLVAPARGSQPLRIGARDLTTGFPFFQGAIDEVAIYRGLLSADEIKQHFEAAQV